MTKLIYTFDYIESQFRQVINSGYHIIRCVDYIAYKKGKRYSKVLVNRVDIDLSIKKAEKLLLIFDTLKIKATFFIRLHAEEYNPFSFENYRILKKIRDSGHEIGYHSEVMDASGIWNEPARECFLRDLNVLEKMLKIKVAGVASHGGNTGRNNLDFWKNHKPSDFHLLYEGYDNQPDFNLFQESLYVSDSNWTSWKCYDKGVLREKDSRSIAEHALKGVPLIYSLIHSDTYYEENHEE